MIAEILHSGEENALPSSYICDLLHISKRDLSAAVERERRAGKPICASTGSPSGYYIAADREEMEAYCRSLLHRAGEIHKTRRACLNMLSELPPRR